jgi:hypothetical protein
MERAARRSARDARELPLILQTQPGRRAGLGLQTGALSELPNPLMKNSVRYLLPLLLGGAFIASASATTVVRRDPNVVRIQISDPVHVRVEKGDKFDKKAPSEKVTFLGVETASVPDALAAQLGLGENMGLVVRRVADDSPAASVLKEHDVLTKFGDQLLVDSRQLSVLIRAKKAGDEVKLTLFRGGKEMTVSVKLAEHEVPRMFGLRSGDMPDNEMFRFFQGDAGGPMIERLRELPGIGRDELRDVLRMIGRERGNWFAGPRVHIMKRKGGSSLLNMAEGNFAYSDEEGAVEINASNGKRQLTVKDAKGNVTFQGPINTDEEREKLPAEVKKRLGKIDSATIDFEADDSLEQEGAAVKSPEKTKTSRELGRDPGRSLGRALRF